MSELFGLVSRTTMPVPLEDVRVSGNILGRGAQVKVAQRFYNAEAVSGIHFGGVASRDI